MDYVVGISWPRSGHHMLVRLLKLYFGSSFHYCGFYRGEERPTTVKRCCGKVPCAYPGKVHFSKNHDFDLSVPQVRGQKYLIQYRDFVPSVVSNFEVFVRNGGEDTRTSFRRFASAEFDRYLDFKQKWVTSAFAQDQLVLDYGALLEDPKGELARAVAYFAPGDATDSDRIAEAVASVDGQKIEQRKVQPLRRSGVHAGRDVTKFRHYGPAIFAQLAELRLHRRTVIHVFREILGRRPAEANMLHFQTFESAKKLEDFLKRSDEYQAVTARRRAAPRAVK